MRRGPRMPLEQLAPFLLVRPETGRLDFPAMFGNDHPVELEIGCGKGGFLVEAAGARPEHNFVGIEIDRALHFYIATRLARRGLANARVMCCDARVLLRDAVADESLAALHVYFPDPWWKKRHHKRRLWTPEFAIECVRVLRPGGRLQIATDVVEYYATMRELLDSRAELERVAADEQAGPADAHDSLTNFERKARSRGGSVWRAEYRRGGSPAGSVTESTSD